MIRLRNSSNHVAVFHIDIKYKATSYNSLLSETSTKQILLHSSAITAVILHNRRMTLTAMPIWGEERGQVKQDRLVLEYQASAGSPWSFQV